MRKLLVSFLGTNDYVPVRYSLAGSVTPEPREFIQEALLELLRGEDQRTHARILVTPGARRERKDRESNWARLKPLIEKPWLDVGEVPISDGGNEGELWGIFRSLGEVLEQGDDVVLDLTHGFRSLPATSLLALSFFRHSRKLTISGVYYGAFETLGRADEVKRKNELGEKPVAPVFDLTPMFSLPAWSEAVAEWDRTGRATGLVDASAPYIKSLRESAPKGLRGLPSSLQELDSVLALVKHDQFSTSAEALARTLDAARSEFGDHPAVAPLAEVVDDLRRQADELSVSGADWKDANRPYLDGQLAVARFYSKRGRVVECFSVLRELIVSCAVRCASAAARVRSTRGGQRAPLRVARKGC